MSEIKPTIEERVAAMKRRVAEKEEQERLERERLQAVIEALQAKQNSLRESLACLADLPVWHPHRGTMEACKINWWSGNPWGVAVNAVSVKLIEFGVHADDQGERSWLTHDGDVIAEDVAVDLAVATVERYLAVGDPSPIPTSDKDGEIPF